MYSNSSGSYKEWKEPIDFDKKPNGLKLVCRWYSRVTARSDVTWTYDTDDSSRYLARYTLCLPELTRDKDTNIYKLNDQDRAAIRDAIKALANVDE